MTSDIDIQEQQEKFDEDELKRSREVDYGNPDDEVNPLDGE